MLIPDTMVREGTIQETKYVCPEHQNYWGIGNSGQFDMEKPISFFFNNCTENNFYHIKHTDTHILYLDDAP